MFRFTVFHPKAAVPRFLAVLLTALGAMAPLAFAQSDASSWELKVCADQDNMPYSNREGEGFENLMLARVAAAIHADIAYVWLPTVRNPSQDTLLLRNGTCDVFLDVGNGQPPYLTTLDYYQSTYEFVYRADAPFTVTSLDDPTLKGLRLGAVAASPAGLGLALRGLIPNTKHYYPTPPKGVSEAMIDDVADGTIDVAAVWGPEAAYYAAQQSVPLKMTPVTPQIDANGLSMVYTASMGVRTDDVELRDLLNEGMAASWDDIQDVLKRFGVPLLPLPKPAMSVIGG